MLHPEAALLGAVVENRDRLVDGIADDSGAVPSVVGLLETMAKADVKGKPDVYIACSSSSCYATVMYAGIINDVLAKCRFTMRTEDDSDWCRLYSSPPWTLPEGTEPEVERKLKDRLLRELAGTILDWRLNGGWRY